eukprot:CCRYP_019659-RA/>CCRYP_019659-RA protein AED:0.06 eAED:0.06 QI:634/1/1/1/1/1/2/380/137
MFNPKLSILPPKQLFCNNPMEVAPRPMHPSTAHHYPQQIIPMVQSPQIEAPSKSVPVPLLRVEASRPECTIILRDISVPRHLRRQRNGILPRKDHPLRRRLSRIRWRSRRCQGRRSGMFPEPCHFLLCNDADPQKYK